MAAGIASAVHQQGEATHSISQSMQGASSDVEMASAEMSATNTAGTRVGEATKRVLSIAEELGRHANGLRTGLDGVVSRLRAA